MPQNSITLAIEALCAPNVFNDDLISKDNNKFIERQFSKGLGIDDGRDPFAELKEEERFLAPAQLTPSLLEQEGMSPQKAALCVGLVRHQEVMKSIVNHMAFQGLWPKGLRAWTKQHFVERYYLSLKWIFDEQDNQTKPVIQAVNELIQILSELIKKAGPIKLDLEKLRDSLSEALAVLMKSSGVAAPAAVSSFPIGDRRLSATGPAAPAHPLDESKDEIKEPEAEYHDLPIERPAGADYNQMEAAISNGDLKTVRQIAAAHHGQTDYFVGTYGQQSNSLLHLAASQKGKESFKIFKLLLAEVNYNNLRAGSHGLSVLTVALKNPESEFSIFLLQKQASETEQSLGKVVFAAIQSVNPQLIIQNPQPKKSSAKLAWMTKVESSIPIELKNLAKLSQSKEEVINYFISLKHDALSYVNDSLEDNTCCLYHYFRVPRKPGGMINEQGGSLERLRELQSTLKHLTYAQM